MLPLAELCILSPAFGLHSRRRLNPPSHHRRADNLLPAWALSRTATPCWPRALPYLFQARRRLVLALSQLVVAILRSLISLLSIALRLQSRRQSYAPPPHRNLSLLLEVDSHNITSAIRLLPLIPEHPWQIFRPCFPHGLPRSW